VRLAHYAKNLCYLTNVQLFILFGKCIGQLQLCLSFAWPSPWQSALPLLCCQGRRQKFVSEGDKTGGLGTKVPQRGPGAELGAKPPEANNHCNSVLKNLIFQHGNFRGGHVPLVPTFPTPMSAAERGSQTLCAHPSCKL